MPKAAPKHLEMPLTREGKKTRLCEHPDCVEPGNHPAPYAPDRLRDYRWFCLEHVRAYNKAWDYFSGMDEMQIERQRRWDTVWQRPSWPFSGRDPENAQASYRIHDPFGFFGDSPGPTEADFGIPAEEREALGRLGLKPPVTAQEIKARYKNLVKDLHPDANGGRAGAEELLKEVNQAYSYLKNRYD